jgi:hypothetical protein
VSNASRASRLSAASSRPAVLEEFVPCAFCDAALLVIGQFAAAKLDFQHLRNAGCMLEGMSLKMSSAMPALEQDALLVCHRIADADPI